MDAILNLSASPFTAGKQIMREEMLGHMARRHGIPLAYVNRWAGMTTSSSMDAVVRLTRRDVSSRAPRDSRKMFWSFDLTRTAGTGTIAADDFEPEAEVWHALVLGVRDYVRKAGFRKVLGVMMPSIYSSAGSISDSMDLARNLGIRTLALPIAEIVDTYGAVLKEPFQGRG